MKICKLYTGDDQQSHFSDVILETQQAPIGVMLSPMGMTAPIIGEIEGYEEISWHNPPCEQFVIMLSGAVEIEIGDGSKRSFCEGDILWAADLSGQGHITRALSAGVRRYLAIPLG